MKDLVNLMNHDAVTRLMSAFANGYYVEHETFTKKTLTFPVYLVMKELDPYDSSEDEVKSVWTSRFLAEGEVRRLRAEAEAQGGYRTRQVWYVDQRDVNKS